MAICKECCEEFSDERKALGYTTCLECGESSAQAEAHRRTSQVACLYNKGPYQYITSKEQTLDFGRK